MSDISECCMFCISLSISDLPVALTSTIIKYQPLFNYDFILIGYRLFQLYSQNVMTLFSKFQITITLYPVVVDRLQFSLLTVRNT